MRCADVDADGARMDGMNGADATGVNGEGTDADGVNGRSGGRGVNIDGARGANADGVRGVGTRGANAGAEGENGATHGASMG